MINRSKIIYDAPQVRNRIHWTLHGIQYIDGKFLSWTPHIAMSIRCECAGSVHNPRFIWRKNHIIYTNTIRNLIINTASLHTSGLQHLMDKNIYRPSVLLSKQSATFSRKRGRWSENWRSLSQCGLFPPHGSYALLQNMFIMKTKKFISKIQENKQF